MNHDVHNFILLQVLGANETQLRGLWPYHGIFGNIRAVLNLED